MQDHQDIYSKKTKQMKDVDNLVYSMLGLIFYLLVKRARQHVSLFQSIQKIPATNANGIEGSSFKSSKKSS